MIDPDLDSLKNVIAGLKIQSMMFDMDIDIETLTLTPKKGYKEPKWITTWKEKEYARDIDNRLDYDQE